MNNVKHFWSRTPGRFVNKSTGDQLLVTVDGKPTFPDFPGTVREWYETLVETIVDVRNSLHRIAQQNPDEINVYVGRTAGYMLETSILYRLPSDDQRVTRPHVSGVIAGMNVYVKPGVDDLFVEIELRTTKGSFTGSIDVLP